MIHTYSKTYVYRDTNGLGDSDDVETRMAGNLVEFINVVVKPEDSEDFPESLLMVNVREPQSGEQFYAFPEELEGFRVSPIDYLSAVQYRPELMDGKDSDQEYQWVYRFRNVYGTCKLAPYDGKPVAFVSTIVEPEPGIADAHELPLVRVCTLDENGRPHNFVAFPDELQGFELSQDDRDIVVQYRKEFTREERHSSPQWNTDFSSYEATLKTAKDWFAAYYYPRFIENVEKAYKSGGIDPDDVSFQLLRMVLLITAENEMRNMTRQDKANLNNLRCFI